MKRLINTDLNKWKQDPKKKPLILRGARQVGKTYAVRQLGAQFESFVKVNLEFQQKARTIFTKDLDPHRIIQELSVLTDKQIIPGKTLLFLDEIQIEPQALIALRYFYEIMPELHIIAAGSLLDFAIQQVGIPVGRVSSLYVYPLTFIEFLHALEHTILIKAIIEHSKEKAISQVIHEKILTLLGNYLAIGGMPEAVASWVSTRDFALGSRIHHSLVDSYRQDFLKYAKVHQLKYLELLFNEVPRQLCHRFKYSGLGEFRKRELAPCLDLLKTAAIIHQVTHTGAHGIPLGAEANSEHFKLIFIDTALAQSILGLDMKEWILDPLANFINKGPIIESFVGQELLAYAEPSIKSSLFYWQRPARGSIAGVDYLIQEKATIIPVKVKSGFSTALFSMYSFLETHPNSASAIHLYPGNYKTAPPLQSYPLYAIASIKESYRTRVEEFMKSS